MKAFLGFALVVAAVGIACFMIGSHTARPSQPTDACISQIVRDFPGWDLKAQGQMIPHIPVCKNLTLAQREQVRSEIASFSAATLTK